MKLYLAPMEGVTGYVFRGAYHRHYGKMDRYFSPFISHPRLSGREIRDVYPENNKGMNLVPQILAGRASDFLSIAKILGDLGYSEVNLNLGCPSGTVIKKKRGAGMLSDPEYLESFLTEIYEKCPLKISIKTRLGMNDPEEWIAIQKIYNKFPIAELIVHPRVRADMYKLPVRTEWFSNALENARVDVSGNMRGKEPARKTRQEEKLAAAGVMGNTASDAPSGAPSSALSGAASGILSGTASDAPCGVLSSAINLIYPIVYNGDICTAKDFAGIVKSFEGISAVMIGRGIIRNPELAEEIRKVQRDAGAIDDGAGEGCHIRDLKRFSEFHEDLLENYIIEMGGENNALFKMKEFWYYAATSFPGRNKEMKELKKSRSVQEYRLAVSRLIR